MNVYILIAFDTNSKSILQYNNWNKIYKFENTNNLTYTTITLQMKCIKVYKVFK